MLGLCQCKNSPPILIEQPQDMIAELDKPMAIHCRTESSSLDDLHIDWYKDGRLVTTDPNARIITEFMALHIINTMPQDAGIYYCIAKNSYGQTQSRKARIQFLKLDKEFPVSPISTSASLGERIRLRCQPPYGSPNPIVYWIKDGKNLSVPLDHYDLILPSIQKSDFGSYRCIASNGLIRQSSIAYLTEFHRPKLTIQPSSSRIDLHRGQSIDLQFNNIKFEYEDKNQYRLKINRIKEYYHNILFKCYYQNKNIRSQGFIKLNVEQIEPPPIISYIPNNQTVPIGVEVIFSCQPKDDINIQWWFIPYNRPYKIIKISDNSQKYRIESNHDLIIQHAEKNDAGLYKCVSINNNYDETIWLGHLHVEDARSNAIFHRVERKDLPQAPSQPIAIDITSNSIELVWDMESIDILDYLIEYYDINSDRNNLEWKQTNERIETITNSITTYTINNLQPNTDYSIYLVPMFDIIGRSSNTISFRTLESIPSSSPTNIIVQLISTTTLSIRWNSPLENETNGQIIAYKVNCLGTNETNSIRLTNISSDAKGLYIKNLIENMEYCISIAARTRIGYGPYSQPICVIMNAKLLQINQNQLKYRLREAISQPWFLPVIILSSIIFICACAYVIWLCFHYITQQHRHRIKFNSSASSSSNQSVELPVHKTLSNGKRYDLIKDTSTPLPSSSTALWMNSIPNGIRLQCCTTASASSNSEHYSMSIHKNPINALLHECRQQQQLNPYATTGIFQQSTSSVSPNYSKTVHSPPASHHLLSDSQQQITSSASPTVQYQPPWLDHHPSSTLQYHSQSRTSFNQYHCIHCTSQSHPQTPSSIRPTIQSPASHHHQNNSLIIKSSILNTNDINKTTMDSLQQITMNSSPLVKHTSDYISQVQPSNLTMINSLGDETMTTSWISSMDDNNHENVSSSSTDKYKHEKSISKQNHSSSEGSIFSDSDIQQQDETNGSTLINFERGPSFLIPNV
ncbi:unnamed protein product [Rotaria sp. Silwood1]|nr:unnamed protein product [Rotaria sp. Silwood1]